jgi:hypothetical protein
VNILQQIIRRYNKAIHSKFGSDEDILLEYVHAVMPKDSGFDTGTKLSLEKTKPDKLVFYTEFHHMNENGFYDGWTTHFVTVRPDWNGISVFVSGKNRNGIKDYIAETFLTCLMEEE